MIDQIAAAPISWGICEVPNWGVQLPPERVLTEMAELGFTQTEAGAAGYLPDDPSELTAVLNSHGLNLFDNALGRVANHNDCLNITLVCCRAVAGESFVERGPFCFDQVLFKFCVVKEPLEASWRGDSPKHGEVRLIVIRKRCDST